MRHHLLAVSEVDDRGLHFEDSFISWREHLAHATAVAATLRARMDPKRPPHVGVLMENTPEHSALLAAAALSGVVVVGLNPVRRGSALQRDVAAADCQLVLAEGAFADTLDGVAHIRADSPEWRAEVATHHGAPLPAARIDPSDLLLLMFTSGTSGDSKAVRCSQHKVAAAAELMANRFELGPADTCYVSMSLFHSAAVMVGWGIAIACRGSLALRRKFSASQFIPDVRRYGATYANYVGKPLSYVLATPSLPDDRDNPLRVAYGNEAAPADISRFAKRFDVRVVDGFGSTEGGVMIRRTPDTPDDALGPLPAGIAILDVDTGEPCPPGIAGELVNISGPGNFEGYYNDPEADAQRMRAGRYHSGDLAYCDEAGYVHFVGRLGDWLRVDGENLGTAPIERVLLRHPDVVEAAVYGVPAPDVGDQVMAALVLTEDARFDPSAFARFLGAQQDLGRKQWPAYVRVSRQLPRTETFKVIKRILAAEGVAGDDRIWRITDPVAPS